jgi:hypothetical protein
VKDGFDGARVVQETVHGQEGFSRGCMGEAAAFWEGAGQEPSQEGGLADRMVVGEAAGVEGGHCG